MLAKIAELQDTIITIKEDGHTEVVVVEQQQKAPAACRRCELLEEQRQYNMLY